VHKAWGPGTVLGYDEDRMTVLFESVGYKTLSVDIVTRGKLLMLGDKHDGAGPDGAPPDGAQPHSAQPHSAQSHGPQPHGAPPDGTRLDGE
jgi:hypothetical protein